jgi:hypothetical protein
MRDFGPIIYYLELNIMRDRKARIIYFTQIAAIDRILKKVKIAEYLSYITFIESDMQFEEVLDSFQIVDQGIYT